MDIIAEKQRELSRGHKSREPENPKEQTVKETSPAERSLKRKEGYTFMKFFEKTFSSNIANIANVGNMSNIGNTGNIGKL